MQSTTSSSSAWVSKVHPKTSVIEVGAGNSYGHPTSATYGRLDQVGSAIYRTDLNGEVTVTTDGTTSRCQNKPTDVGLCENGNNAAGGEYPEFRWSGLRLLVQSIQL